MSYCQTLFPNFCYGTSELAAPLHSQDSLV